MEAIKNYVDTYIKENSFENKKTCIRCHSNKKINEFEKIMRCGNIKILTMCKDCRIKTNKKNKDKKNKIIIENIEY